MTTTRIVPTSAMVSRCASTLWCQIHDAGVRTIAVSGGWSAAGFPVNGELKPLPSASAFAWYE